MLEQSVRDSRAAVLDTVRGAAGPLTVADIAAAVGLHPNTVRGHLDLLVHLGYLRRAVEPRDRPGRPRVLFSAAEAQERPDAYRVLATALSAAPDVAAAGDRWADTLARSGRITPCAEPDEAVRQVAGALDDFGFAARTEPLGDRLYLTRCPYAAMLQDAPVVCDVHLSLITAALEATGAPVRVQHLDVLPRPGLCVAHLSRGDLHPVRTIANTPTRDREP